MRAVFPRTLLYVAHNAEEAEAIPFWPMLDLIGVSLYPPLGSDDDRAGRLTAMRGVNWSRLSEQKFRVDKWNLCRG